MGNVDADPVPLESLGTAIAVPQPQNGSRIMSPPGLLLAQMLLCKSVSGFWVGYPSRSAARAEIGECQSKCRGSKSRQLVGVPFQSRGAFLFFGPIDHLAVSKASNLSCTVAPWIPSLASNSPGNAQ